MIKCRHNVSQDCPACAEETIQSLADALVRIRDFPHSMTICEQAMSQIAREALRVGVSTQTERGNE